MLIILNDRGTEVDIERVKIEKFDMKKDASFVSLSVDGFNIGWFRKLYVANDDYEYLSSFYLAKDSTVLKRFGDNILLINLGNKSKDKELFINNSNVNIINKDENKVLSYVTDLLSGDRNTLTYVPLEV